MINAKQMVDIATSGIGAAAVHAAGHTYFFNLAYGVAKVLCNL